MHGNAAQLPLGIALAGKGEELFGVLVRFLAAAEHVLFITVEVALSEALTGEGLFKRLHLLVRGLAVLLERLGIYLRDYRGVLGALHPALDLEAGDARVLELAQPVDKAVVLEGHGVIVHAPAEAVLHAAGLGAHAAVAAAAAYERGHIALA